MTVRFFVFLTIASFLSFEAATAQFEAHVLTQNNVMFKVGDVGGYPIDVSKVPSFGTGSNAQWDMSAATISSTTPSGILYTQLTSGEFADKYSAELFEYLTPSRGMYVNFIYDYKGSGISEIGYTVAPQTYAIGDLTGNMADSLFITEQSAMFDTPRFLLPFPCTEGTAVTSGYDYRLTSQISLASYNLNKVPFERLSATVQYDTVIGWGRMIAPTPDGPSKSYNVLMVYRMSVKVDSFVLMGMPAPKPMLDAFGISQGQVSTNYRVLFWNEGGNQYPTLSMSFADQGLSQLVNAFVNAELEAASTGVDEFSSPYASMLSPNPVSGHTVRIEFADNAPTAAYISIVGTLGMEMDVPFIVHGNAATLDVSNLAAGAYSVSARSANGELIARQSFVATR